MVKNLYFFLYMTLVLLPAGILRAQDGTLDSGFGTGGIVTTSFVNGSVDAANDIAIQTDGKIIAAGSSVDPNSGMERFSLARYLTNGALDNSFGSSGKVTTDVLTGYSSTASAVELQPDGKIVVAGYANDTNATTTQNGYFVAARYKTNGTLDSTFGNNGIAAYQIPAVFDPEVMVSDMFIQPDSQIVIAGGAFVNWTEGDMVFMRLDFNGTPDPTFGNSGMSIQAPQFGGAFPTAIARLMDGRIAVACIIDASTHNDPLLTALSTSGIIDLNFGTAGFVNVYYGSSSGFLGVTVQTDDKIVACGFGFTGAVVARFNNDGSTDASFGTAGAHIVPIGTAQDAAFEDVEVQQDGKIIAAGSADAQFAMVRMSDIGVLDVAFGNSGIVQTSIGPGIADGAAAISLQSDGKIVLGGYSYSMSATTPAKYALARYNNTVTDVRTEVGAETAGMYPNPFAEIFTIENCPVNSVVNITDAQGSLVMTINTITTRVQVDFSGMASGVYFVEITSGDQTLRGKAVKL